MIRVCMCALFLGVFTASCSSFKPPTTYTFDKSRTYGENYDVVWGRVIQWFAENGTPIKNIEKASGLITTEYNLDAASYSALCDCGKNGTYETVSDPVGNFNVLVQSVGDSTKVTINCSYKTEKTMTDLYGKEMSKSTMTCNSTGKIETSILDYISSPS